MRPKLRKIKLLINSPFTQFITGLILLFSGLATAYYEFQSAENSLRVGVHHGVILWALVQVLGSLPDLIDGFERSLVVIEKRDES